MKNKKYILLGVSILGALLSGFTLINKRQKQKVEKKAKTDSEKKKILVICQYYKPEPFRISDICEEMVKRGHEVHVVTGYPNYPEGILYDGYGKGQHIDEIVNGVKIHRCYTAPRGRGKVRRMGNYYSYSIASTAYVLSNKCVASDGSNFDIVFCNQLSPIMMAHAAIAYKRKHKVPAVMYCLDLWPESLIAGGITRKSLIYKYYHGVSRYIYRTMDKILVTSRMFTDYLHKEFEIDKRKIEYLPQYAEEIFEPIPLKKENGIFDFLFAGNIGEIQSVDTIINAAKLLAREPVRFHIVGGGTDLNRLRKMAKGMDNVFFYGRRPLEEMPLFYEKADAMLVTLKADPILSLTLPGKIQSYMAVGKPVIGAIDGEASTIIKEAGCGLCGKAEQVDTLADNIKKFITENEKRNKYGLAARKFYKEHFEQEMFMDKLEDYLL